jgi:hypothetical protein
MVVLERRWEERREAIIEMSILGTVDDDLHVIESCIGSAVRSRRDIGNPACDNWSRHFINAYSISRRYCRVELIREHEVVPWWHQMLLREIIVPRRGLLHLSVVSVDRMLC